MSIVKKVIKYANEHGERVESSRLFGKKGLLERFKKNRNLQSRVSKQYPGDTLGQHFKRVGKVKRIQEWGGIMSGEVPTSKKPEVKRKREKLLPKRVGYKS